MSLCLFDTARFGLLLAQTIDPFVSRWVTELKLIRDFGGVEQQNCHMQIVVRFKPMGDFANPFNALSHEPWLDFCLAFYFSIGQSFGEGAMKSLLWLRIQRRCEQEVVETWDWRTQNKEEDNSSSFYNIFHSIMKIALIV